MKYSSFCKDIFFFLSSYILPELPALFIFSHLFWQIHSGNILYSLFVSFFICLTWSLVKTKLHYINYVFASQCKQVLMNDNKGTIKGKHVQTEWLQINQKGQSYKKQLFEGWKRGNESQLIAHVMCPSHNVCMFSHEADKMLDKFPAGVQNQN